MIAAGHNMIGLSAVPGTGKLVAEIMAGASPHIDPHPYRIARYHK
jgi:D-amino-acid dehydrogenase